MFPYVCPEPVLVNRSFSNQNGIAKDAFSAAPAIIAVVNSAIVAVHSASWSKDRAGVPPAERKTAFYLSFPYLCPPGSSLSWQKDLCMSGACLGKIGSKKGATTFWRPLFSHRMVRRFRHRPSCLRPCGKRISLFECCFLCLSRACLGEIIGFSTKWRNRCVFRTSQRQCPCLEKERKKTKGRKSVGLTVCPEPVLVK
eukprot:COSAG06_NODE_2445_length_6866_cov_9.468450_4_plen_198_part_00